MTENDLLSRIKGRLYPYPYTDEVVSSGDFYFLLYRKTGFPGGKYVVASMELSNEISYDDFIGIRSRAKHLIKSMWMFRPTGIYLILCGSEDLWRGQTKFVTADSTGLHSIIVQAVHFFDPHSRASHLSRSSWGPIEFGDVGRVFKIVKEELEKG